MPAPDATAALVVMGVSASGKTSIGKGVAARLGWSFADGDDFHPKANVAKMAAGHPLTDEDRWPWLDAIAAYIDNNRRAGHPVVVACSALRRIYRDRLRAGHSDVRFLYLKGSHELLEDRIGHRSGHFMPSSLLDSQFATLEEPGPDEHPVTVSIDGTQAQTVDRAMAELGGVGLMPAGAPAS